MAPAPISRPNPPLTTSGVRDSVATAPWPRPSSGVAVGTRAVPSPSTGRGTFTAPAIQSTTATPSVQAVMPSDAAQAHARALWSHLALLPLHGNDVRGLVKRFNDVASDCFQLGWSLSDVALCDLFRSKFKCNPLYDDLLRTTRDERFAWLSAAFVTRQWMIEQYGSRLFAPTDSNACLLADWYANGGAPRKIIVKVDRCFNCERSMVVSDVAPPTPPLSFDHTCRDGSPDSIQSAP